MNCLNVRRHLLSEPSHHTPQLQQHLEHCHSCQQLAHRLSLLDTEIKDSLNTKVPDGLANKILLAKSVRENSRKLKFNQRLKIAGASLVLVLGSIASVMHLSTPVMIEEIAMTHINDELHHLSDKKNLQLAQVNTVLSTLNMRLEQTKHTINYAGSCKILFNQPR